MKRLRLAAGVATALLWAADVGECITSVRGLSPALDQLLDSLTCCATVGVAAWYAAPALRAMVRAESARRDARLDAVFDAISATCKQAGVPVENPRDSGQQPVMRLVRDERQTG